ncbi:MAG: hypothetical protein U0521_20950 [Anaerolineae bacterium]
MLVIHGTRSQPDCRHLSVRGRPDERGQDAFELKVYSGEPHGFMLANGALRSDDVAQDAFDEMAAFFGKLDKK